MTTIKAMTEILGKLDGNVDVRGIAYSNKFDGEIGENYNHFTHIHYAHGVYFYTDRRALERHILSGKKDTLPTYVIIKGSNDMFRISTALIPTIK